ncbi:MAG: hypothetical protein ABI543_15185 [Ignavibacteria bacterium]
MKLKSFFIILVIIATSLFVCIPSNVYSQATTVCKLVFCNCCERKESYDIFDINGNYAGGFTTQASGCQDIVNWVNLVPEAGYYVQPRNCPDAYARTYFTACLYSAGRLV